MNDIGFEQLEILELFFKQLESLQESLKHLAANVPTIKHEAKIPESKRLKYISDKIKVLIRFGSMLDSFQQKLLMYFDTYGFRSEDQILAQLSGAYLSMQIIILTEVTFLCLQSTALKSNSLEMIKPLQMTHDSWTCGVKAISMQNFDKVSTTGGRVAWKIVSRLFAFTPENSD